jgi:hypothetical protein
LDWEQLVKVLVSEGMTPPFEGTVVGLSGGVIGSVQEVIDLAPGFYGLWIKDARGRNVFIRFLKG